MLFCSRLPSIRDSRKRCTSAIGRLFCHRMDLYAAHQHIMSTSTMHHRQNKTWNEINEYRVSANKTENWILAFISIVCLIWTGECVWTNRIETNPMRQFIILANISNCFRCITTANHIKCHAFIFRVQILWCKIETKAVRVCTREMDGGTIEKISKQKPNEF